MGSIGLPTSHHLHPPFPDDVTTAPLVSVSLFKLENGDKDESKAFFEAARNLGFFYLDLEGSDTGERIVEEAERLNKIQKEFYDRPQEEREEYARERIDSFFGYRQSKIEGTNDDGSSKRNEIYNASGTGVTFRSPDTNAPCRCEKTILSEMQSPCPVIHL